MPLFSGIACFSPSVPQQVIDAWKRNGGILAIFKQETRIAEYYFCAGSDDPWVPPLANQSVIVFHCGWILGVMRNSFPIPISRYILNVDPDLKSGVQLKCNETTNDERTEHDKALDLKQVPRKKRPLSPDEVPQSDQRPRKKARHSKTIQASNHRDDKPAERKILKPIKAANSGPLEIDLRKILLPQKRTTMKPVELKYTTTAHMKAHQPRQTSALKTLFMGPSTCASGSPRRIPVSLALGTLRSMTATDVCATRFLPGAEYLGQEFRCFHTDTTVSRP